MGLFVEGLFEFLQGVSAKRNHFCPINNLTHFYFFNCVFSLKNERATCSNFKNAFLNNFFFKKVMVWACITHKEKGLLTFIEEGVKINHEVYVRLLEDEMLPSAKETFGWDEEEKAFLEN